MPEGPDREIVVEFDRVGLRFEEKIVLREVSFRLERGETKVVLGVTGSGKSILLKLTMGLLKPDSGRIFVLGEEITKLSEPELFPIRQKIGMVFQESALFDSLTVRENVGYVFEQSSQITPQEAERRVREALRFVELEPAMDLLPAELSGGMRRRVAIARAVVGQPQIILYDSPTAGLDPITASRIMTLVVKQRDVSQVSSLLVTQRVRDAFLMALYYYDPAQEKLLPARQDGALRDTHTRFLMLREGAILFHGTLEELIANGDPYVRRYLV
ncbi:MAG: ATP-binding cassette domain-containing protein [Acidobacteria bacterium]|nr:ATP-binding cassette domain-containing protein [Acidobacteriota bacterium]